MDTVRIYLLCNLYIIITLIGFTDAQYDALSVLVEDICSRYQIPMDRAHIIGHEEYSPQKQDPGQLFDWSRIMPEAVG